MANGLAAVRRLIPRLALDLIKLCDPLQRLRRDVGALGGDLDLDVRFAMVALKTAWT